MFVNLGHSGSLQTIEGASIRRGAFYRDNMLGLCNNGISRIFFTQSSNQII